MALTIAVEWSSGPSAGAPRTAGTAGAILAFRPAQPHQPSLRMWGDVSGLAKAAAPQAGTNATYRAGDGVVGWCLTCWERARQRRALALLDDHRLEDIGICRVEARQETRKPFWRS